ncbi:phage holin [Paucilactobacillus hokkaidonensis]
MKINWNIRLKSKKYWLTVITPVVVVIAGRVIYCR